MNLFAGLSRAAGLLGGKRFFVGATAPGRPTRAPGAFSAQGAGALAWGRDAGCLARVGEAEVELAVWQRRLPAALSEWLAGAEPADWPVARGLVEGAGVAAALRAAFGAAGSAPAAVQAALAEDIAALVERFARLAGTASVSLRLDRVADNGCRKLHRDCVPLRLVTTYCGPGTDWVMPEHAEVALARPDDYSGPLERLPPHAVALFKGCGWPGSTRHRGIVHRSPRIEATGVQRLVLCLSPVFGREQGALA